MDRLYGCHGQLDEFGHHHVASHVAPSCGVVFVSGTKKVTYFYLPINSSLEKWVDFVVQLCNANNESHPDNAILQISVSCRFGECIGLVFRIHSATDIAVHTRFVERFEYASYLGMYLSTTKQKNYNKLFHFV